MAKLIICCFVLLSFAEAVRCQQPADILWARGGSDQGELDITSLQYSVYTHTIIAVTVGGEWQSWPVGPVSLPLRNRPAFRGSPYPSVLTKGGRELLSGLTSGDVYAWDLTTNQITDVGNFGPNVEWLDATADGNLVATSSNPDGVLHVYDRAAGREIIRWSNSVGCVSFSPDGKLLLAGSNNNLVLIDVAARRIIHRFTNIVNYPAPVAFSPTRPGVFVVQDDSFWEMDTSGRIIATLDAGTTTSRNSIAFSPSGNLLAVEVGGGMVLLDLNTGAERNLPRGYLPCFISEDTLVSNNGPNINLVSVLHASILGSLTSNGSYELDFIPDGSALLDGWNPCSVLTGQIGAELFPSKYANPNAYSLHGTMAASRTYDGAYFWEDPYDTAIVFLDSIRDSVCYGLAAISPDSSIFAVAMNFGFQSPSPGEIYTTIELWSTVTRQLIYRYLLSGSYYQGPPNALIFSHDGSLIAMSDGDSCYIMSVHDSSIVSAFERSPDNNWGAEAIAFLPGDTSLLFRGYEVRTLLGKRLSYMPSNTRAQIIRLPDGRYFGGFDYYYGSYDYGRGQWADSTITFFDLNQGKVTDSVTIIERQVETTMAVNPATGDFAMGGQDLIYYKSIDPGTSSVKEYPSEPVPSDLSLEAYQQGKTIALECSLVGVGHVSIYRSDGERMFAREVSSVPLSTIIPGLPSGLYFAVLENDKGERVVKKVLLLE